MFFFPLYKARKSAHFFTMCSLAKYFHRFFMVMAVRAYSYHVSLPCNENSSAVTLAGIGGVGTACFFSRELPKEISENTVKI